jgi:hypothetical protein
MEGDLAVAAEKKNLHNGLYRVYTIRGVARGKLGVSVCSAHAGTQSMSSSKRLDLI